MSETRPRARFLHNQTGEHYRTVAQPVGDELLVYDPWSRRAHSLNRTAARIYEACLDEGDWAQEELESAFGPDVLRAALQELEKAELIVWWPSEGLRRRRFLKALSFPMVYSVLLPVVAAAASACATTIGDPGCVAAVLPGTGGGASGLGPGGCVGCCGPSTPCTSCPSGCTTCSCIQEFTCSTGGGIGVTCKNADPGICTAGTNDFPVNSAACRSDGSSFFTHFSCATARAAAVLTSGSVYACCSCP